MFHFYVIDLLLLLGPLRVLLLGLTWVGPFSSRAFNHAENTEFLYTAIPIIILLVIGGYSIKSLFLSEEINSGVDLSVKVMGHQWFWSYEFSDLENIEFDRYLGDSFSRFFLLESFPHLVVPNDSQSRVLARSFDVLHSWAIPSLGVKVDVIPGRLNRLFLSVPEGGLYYGQCSEICGVNHSLIPITLEAIPPVSWLKWASKQL